MTMRAWQPMETAPNEFQGQDVLLAYQNGSKRGVTAANWYGNGWLLRDMLCVVPAGHSCLLGWQPMPEPPACGEKGDRPMTGKEIVDQTNELAAIFYKLHGNARPSGFRFDMATHPQEEMMWALAAEAMLLLRNTDANDARANLDD